MALVTKANDLHRPMRGAAVAEAVTSLSGATAPPVAKDFRFPMTQASAVLVAAAVNEVDTSGEPAVTAKDFHDPWNAATVRRMAAFTT